MGLKVGKIRTLVTGCMHEALMPPPDEFSAGVAQQVEQAVEARCLRGFDSYPFHKNLGGLEQRELVSFIS